jgi:hypothetical protein
MVAKGTSTISGGKKQFIQQDILTTLERKIDNATFSGDETLVGKQFN